MAKREFVQLAHNYNPMKHGIGGWWWSEKIDGHRAFWDGGITTGLLKESVPWANTAKDERFVERQYATGLWSRYGNVIHAPRWWTDTLPKVPLGGELSNHIRGNRQTISSIVKKIEPDYDEWETIDLMVFNSPPLVIMFADGRIDNIHYKKTFSGIVSWINQQHFPYEKVFESNVRFRSVYAYLHKRLNVDQVKSDKIYRATLHIQHELSWSTTLAKEQIDFQNQQISEKGGEGLIVRNPDGLWKAERSHTIVKVKNYDDAEATVIGYVTGRQTDKGSKLLGLMGAMIVDWNGKIFELSGFTEEERILTTTIVQDSREGFSVARDWAERNPETKCPNEMYSMLFPRGSRVTFKYRGLTEGGIPNEASYWRKEDII